MLIIFCVCDSKIWNVKILIFCTKLLMHFCKSVFAILPTDRAENTDDFLCVCVYPKILVQIVLGLNLSSKRIQIKRFWIFFFYLFFHLVIYCFISFPIDGALKLDTQWNIELKVKHWKRYKQKKLNLSDHQNATINGILISKKSSRYGRAV